MPTLIAFRLPLDMSIVYKVVIGLLKASHINLGKIVNTACKWV